MAYSPSKVLALIDEPLRKQLIEACGLSFDEALFAHSEALYSKLQQEKSFTAVESLLRELKDMSSEESIERLMEFAGNLGVQLDEDFEKCSNDLSKSVWFYLNHNDIFKDAFLWDHLSHYGSEYALQSDVQLSLSFFDEGKCLLLKGQLQEHFKKDRKARDCEVEVHENPSTHNLCISVFFDDHSRSEFSFNPNSILEKVARRPVKELHFVVFPKEKKVALQFKKVRHKKKAALMKIFVESIIREDFDDNEFRTLSLDTLLEDTFSFKLPQVPPLDFVRIKLLRLDGKVGHRNDRVTLDVKDGDNPRAIYDLMDRLRVVKDAYSVSQAVVHFQFRDMGKRGSVTVTLTMPNSDNFQDNSLHLICKKSLMDSGLMR